MRRISFDIRRCAPASASAAVSAAVLAVLNAVPAPAYAQSPGVAGIEEVVVTARKREESVLDTPIAITALTGEDIAAKGIVNFNQLADATPGITISNVSSGRSDRSFQQITLRGMVPSSSNQTLVSTFIDGVPVASATAVQSVVDPARVEIIKGPQAAYFGRNTFAGAINVVNKTPTKDLGGALTIQGGNRSNMDLQASLSGPLSSDIFGFRVATHFMKKDGSYKNTANLSETLGDQETKSASLLLTANPGDNLSVKLFTMYSQDDDGPSVQGMIPAYEIRSVNGVTNIPFLSGNSNGTLVLPSLSNCTMNGFQFGRAATETRVSRPYFCGAAPKLPKGFSPAQNTFNDALLQKVLANDIYRVVSPSDGTKGYGLVREYWHSHLNIDYKIGDTGYTVSSLTGINDDYFSEIEDLDNYDTRLLANPNNPNGTNPNFRSFWDFVYGVERENRDFSQELRVSFDRGGRFTGMLGASYLKTLVWNDLVAATNEVLGPTPATNGRVPQGSKNQVVTKGVFFGLTYKFTDQLKLNAEGRYQQDQVTGFVGSTSTTLTANAAANLGLAAGTYAPLSELISKKYNKFLPRVIVQYDFNKDVMVYGSYSKGVNVGVNTFNTSFLNGSSLLLSSALALGLKAVQDPEELTNYEIGLKGKFFDNRLIAQLAAYSGKWKNQLNNRQIIIQDLPVSQGGTGSTAQATGFANSGDVDVRGIEVDLLARVNGHIDLNFAAAMNDSSINSFVGPSISQMTGIIGDGFKGKQLPQTAKFSWNAGAMYTTPAPFVSDAEWFTRFDVSWKDKQYVDAANMTWIKARTVANLRTGVTRGALSVDLYVNNLFNDSNYVSIAQNSLLTPNLALAAFNGYLNVGLPELRTFGARVSYKF